MPTWGPGNHISGLRVPVNLTAKPSTFRVASDHPSHRLPLQSRNDHGILSFAPGPLMYLFTLVHGTKLLGPLEGKSNWTALDSQLSLTLQNAFPQSTISTVTWSGWNSVWARRRAVDTLRKHIHMVAQTQPKANHVIIAHSHGGNVALAALSDPPAVSGLICLGTPFLQYRRRRGVVEPLARDAVLIGTKLLIFVSALFVIFSIALSSRWALYTLVLLFPAFMAARARIVRRVNRAINDCKRFAGQVSARTWSYLLTTSTFQAPLLIIRVAGDEASAILASSQLLGWIAHWTTTKAISLLSKAFLALSFLFRSKRRIVILVSVYVLASLISGFISANGQSRVVDLFTRLPSYATSATLLGLLVLYALPFAALILSAIAALPYGIDASIISFLYEITAESTPVGSWRIDSFPPAEDTSTSMAHTAIYNNPAVIARVTQWIEGLERQFDADDQPLQEFRTS